MKNILILSFFLLNSVISFGQNKDCRCYKGIGSNDQDIPNLIYNFSNGQKISVCGFEQNRTADNELLISEFNVFNCETGTVYVEYEALQNCKVSIKNNALEIIELRLYPAGENWEWMPLPIGIERIYEKGNDIISTGQLTYYHNITIKKERIDAFYIELENMKLRGELEDLELIIGKLELLAINGEEKAKSILIDFENYFNYLTDGAIAELWKDAVATVEWIK